MSVVACKVSKVGAFFGPFEVDTVFKLVQKCPIEVVFQFK